MPEEENDKDGWESTSLSEEADADGEWVDVHHSSSFSIYFLFWAFPGVSYFLFGTLNAFIRSQSLTRRQD